MDIKENKAQRIERKLLSEESWINLGDGLEVRIDYLTRGQEVEFRRLASMWEIGVGSDKQHYWGYFVRAISKSIKGLTIEGLSVTAEHKNGLLENLVCNEKKYDYIATLLELGVMENLYYEAYARLMFDEVDKKKLKSVQESLKTEGI